MTGFFSRNISISLTPRFRALQRGVDGDPELQNRFDGFSPSLRMIVPLMFVDDSGR